MSDIPMSLSLIHICTEQGKESNFKRGWHMVMRGFREMLS